MHLLPSFSDLRTVVDNYHSIRYAVVSFHRTRRTLVQALLNIKPAKDEQEPNNQINNQIFFSSASKKLNKSSVNRFAPISTWSGAIDTLKGTCVPYGLG